MALTPYTWADEWVVPGGAGANDGSNFANGWDITQVAASLAAGKRFNFAGSFGPLTIEPTWTTAGTNTNPIGFLGWKADQSAPAVSFADMPSIDGNATRRILGGSWQTWKGLRFTNGNGFSSSGDNCAFDLMEMDNHVGVGMLVDNYNNFSRCRIYDNGTYGIQADNGTHLAMCELYDNGTYGLEFGGATGSAYGCFIARNATGIRFISQQNVIVNQCTLDGNTTAALAAITGGPLLLMASQLTNNAVAVNSVGHFVSLYNNLYGNTSDGAGAPHISIGETALDPQYVDVANNDYEIQNASLIGVTTGLLGTNNIGAWQSSGGGAAGGMLVHPGMAGGLRG